MLDDAAEPMVVEAGYAITAELALWRGEPTLAREQVLAGLHLLEGNIGVIRTHRLDWLLRRAEADLGAAAGSKPPVSTPRPSGMPAIALDSGYLALRDTEASRLAGASDPATWDAATAAWQSMGANYLAGYPQLRSAEAYAMAGDLATAGRRLSDVSRLADELGALPLANAVADLARRARLRPAHKNVLPGRRRHPAGLTERELDVLRLIVGGHTDRKIAAHLFISTNTVGVHVSRVLAKLGVSRRGQVAERARQLGLLSDPHIDP
jgi:DNA-binding CsgD family transcriptional regulator